LLNKAQQDIDKTTNEAAKVRLKNYMEETKMLQEKNQLSNLELEIQQAKYDVLLAEIALEEAQNAKSTVRLRRDSEGNFGYVYTADQEAVSQAEQELLDAQNALYNIGLEGTNEYGQRIIELQQQLSDDLIALEEARVAGQFATEAEYYAERDRIINEYNNLFKAYSEQYTTAVGVDANLQQEAWVNMYDTTIEKSLSWKDLTTEYLKNCEDAYKSWEDEVAGTTGSVPEVEKALKDAKTATEQVKDESQKLANIVTSQLLPALANELSAVAKTTAAWGS
jgi:hypothetical protein